MNFSYDSSVTGQKRSWFEDALEYCTFPWDRVDMTVNVEVVEEPSCPGHKDYMCTQVTGEVASIEIRVNADDPEFHQPPGPLVNFYMESVIHEMGHAFIFAQCLERVPDIVTWFTKTRLGEGTITGTESDWNPLEAAWEDRIQEAAAEFFKDVYFPNQYRVYEQRTNWEMKRGSYAAWVQMIEDVICPIVIGGGDT